MNNMISHYLLPRSLHPTCVTDHSTTVIDNIYSNNTSYETVSGNIVTHIYDHFPQFIILTKTNIDYKRCSFSKRDFSKFYEQKFVDSFAGNNLDFLADRELSLDQKFYLFYQNLSSHVEHYAPSKIMNKRDLKLHEKPWITSKIQKLKKHQEKLLRKLNRKFTYDTEYLYKKFRNKVVSEIRSSKIDYYNHYFVEHQSNMKMLWTGIRSIINIKSKQFHNISQLVQNSEIVQNSKEIANIFDNYFVNITGKIDSEIPRTRKSPLDYLGDKLEKSFFISPTNSGEVESIIAQLKNKKSAGPYSVPCNLLKMLCHLVSLILATLINESFSSVIFLTS